MAKTVKRRKDEAPVATRAIDRHELEEAERFASLFKALGDATRLRVVLFLRASGAVSPARIDNLDGAAASGPDDEAEDEALPAGVTVGDIAIHLTGKGRVSSNVSHHLKELRHAGLIAMKRRGKNVFCALETEAVQALAFLLQEKRK